jgi:SDR family mycofactocin-dependent oxidoreductase
VGKLDGKVAFVTGAGRGQGRSHAIRLAEEGADIIAVDICAPIDTVPYPLASPEELAVTAKEVVSRGRRVVAEQADVRDDIHLQKVFDAGVGELGPVDIVVANAGIASVGEAEKKRSAWQDVIDVNLTGVFNTVEVALPSMIERGKGGVIVLTSSTAGLTGIGGLSRGGLAYTASKHGVVGLMRNYATKLAPYSIRVNTVHPTGVNTMMVMNDAMQELLRTEPSRANGLTNALPVELIEAVDISNAIVWLASDDARYVTGITLPVDAGFTLKT